MSTRPNELQIPPWEELQGLLIVHKRPRREVAPADEAPLCVFLDRLKEKELLRVTAEEAWTWARYGDGDPQQITLDTVQVKVIGSGRKPERADGPFGFYIDVVTQPFHTRGYHGPFTRVYIDQLRDLQLVK